MSVGKFTNLNMLNMDTEAINMMQEHDNSNAQK